MSEPLASQEFQPGPIKVSYQDLKLEGIQDRLLQALGSERGCLGLIIISDLPPEFSALREKLFRLAHRLADLPEKDKQTLERPETSYMFGWSHAKEVMNGRPDTQKGSYYANPLIDYPDVTEELRAAHPEYYAGNVWPNGIEGMEEFESTFKQLGAVIFKVGIALARACESFVTPALSNPNGTLSSLITLSKANKARLLHYFPENFSSAPWSDVQNDALCGTHLDHSLLTGLCSGMYLDTSNPCKIVPSPSDTTGLWIYPRESKTPIKVTIPPDCLAFQTGEALSLLTSGRLAATRHFVSGGTCSSNPVSRETFAFFLQPDVGDVIGQDGETFGEFTKRVLGRHYSVDVTKDVEG